MLGDRQITKLVSHLMCGGKKSLTYSVSYRTFDIVKDEMSQEEKSALETWKVTLDNVTPRMKVKSRRIGGATFQVPTEIHPKHRESISMKSLVIFVRKRGGKMMVDKLVAEIMSTYNSQGGTSKRKEDVHRMVEANRALVHLRF